ncbi:MAG: prepilin-type N-terminal cleavage/methylation domain-containing protein [Desulfobacterales bacterium]|jgi:prepilin-type N-terminal cleavage/methylation domain-containing protein
MTASSLFRTNRGFSVFELTVVIGILSIVIAAMYGVFASINRSTTNTEVRAEIMQKLRTAIDFMEQDIRMAGLDRYKSAEAGIVYADDFKLNFTADRNMDGDIDKSLNMDDGIQEGELEYITYEWDSSDNVLKQSLGTGPSQEVARNVADFKFTYYDDNDDTIAPPGAGTTKDDIRVVKVKMTVQQPAGRSGTISRTLTKRILCRNLYYE